MNKAAWAMIMGLMLLVGCKRNPIERLVDPVPSEAQPFPATGGRYVVFDDELKTGGGLAFIPGGQNQSINLNYTDGSRPGRQIVYAWNGNNVSSMTSVSQHAFAGFELLVTNDFTGFDTATGKNLSAANYTTLKLSIRGALSDNTILRIEGPDDGAGGITPAVSNITSLGANWQDVTLSIPSADFANVKAFIIVTFQFAQPSGSSTPGGGGIVYLDDIRYEQ